MWFSSCSCSLPAVGTVSSWFKASPDMCTWLAVGELTGRHEDIKLPWFTSVFSPKLLFFFFWLSSSYFLFSLNRSVFSHLCILLLQLLTFHYIIVLHSFQFAGIQKFLIKIFFSRYHYLLLVTKFVWVYYCQMHILVWIFLSLRLFFCIRQWDV